MFSFAGEDLEPIPYRLRETIHQTKRCAQQTMNWEELFANHTSNKWLIGIVYKELLQVKMCYARVPAPQ